MLWLYVAVIFCLADLAAGEQPKIIIVGAGPSGVAAASKLYENGFQDVTILEAENRIGGRVNSTWFDEGWIDLGAQWVHGQTNNIAFRLAEPLGLLEVPDGTRESAAVYDSEGNLIPTSVSDDLFEVFTDALSGAYDDLRGSNESLGEYFTRTINVGFAAIPAANETLKKQFTRIFENLENAEDSSSNWYNTSAIGYIEAWSCPGSNGVNWKDRAYGTILDVLMKKYPNPENELPVRNNTKLNTEVVKIDYNSTEGKVLVESGNGEKYTADHVIVTTSLGVLKEEYETLFAPGLPELKIKTIKGLAFGTAGKIFMSFEAPWWTDEFDAFILAWTEEDRQEYENDENKKWMLDIVSFAPVTHRPRVLYGWLNAPGVRSMEALPEDQVLNQLLGLLNKFFGKSYNITTPTGFIRSGWSTAKHFRGAYSYRSMESEAADVWADDLATPILVNDKPVVMFAGEATHTHYYSTVHGAIETGFREAKRLIDLYNQTATKS